MFAIVKIASMKFRSHTRKPRPSSLPCCFDTFKQFNKSYFCNHYTGMKLRSLSTLVDDKAPMNKKVNVSISEVIIIKEIAL